MIDQQTVQALQTLSVDLAAIVHSRIQATGLKPGQYVVKLGLHIPALEAMVTPTAATDWQETLGMPLAMAPRPGRN